MLTCMIYDLSWLVYVVYADLYLFMIYPDWESKFRRFKFLYMGYVDLDGGLIGYISLFAQIFYV